jgi:ubiquinone/menaquinone biosynthesis C-methylase UbiE
MQHRSAAEYWSEYHVDSPDEGFISPEESLRHFEWRNSCYLGYIESMPVNSVAGKVVLDYGCGPGNDLIGFAHFGSPDRLIGVDVSAGALRLAAKRLACHNFVAELYQIFESPVTTPLPDASVDVVHCSGVIMMTPQPESILKEFFRVLKPVGYHK